MAIPIVETRLTGDPIHVGHSHGEGAQEGHDEAFVRGSSALGPVAFSLLRSEFYARVQHRRKRLDQLIAERAEILAELEVAHRAAVSFHEHRRAAFGLFMWEAVGVFAEFCEQLAALVTARRNSAALVSDLGHELLAFKAPATSILEVPEFLDMTWWREELSLDDVTRDAIRRDLDDRLQPVYTQVADEADARLSSALASVATTYDEPLHRVAQRRKHAFPYVSPWIGLVWLPPDPAGQAAASDIVNGGGFALLDQRGKAGEQWQMFVAADDGAIDAVLRAANDASWLIATLAGAILTRAENPTGRTVVFNDERLPDGLEDFTAIVSVASGHSQGPLLAMTTRAMEEESRIETLRSSGHVPSVGRNDLCPCGSGRKYKRCHGR